MSVYFLRILLHYNVNSVYYSHNLPTPTVVKHNMYIYLSYVFTIMLFMSFSFIPTDGLLGFFEGYYCSTFLVRTPICLFLLNCHPLGSSLEQWRACIGMFKNYMYSLYVVSGPLFLSCNIVIANLLAFCKLICKVTSSFMKENDIFIKMSTRLIDLH